ncbi:MAG: TolC family protein [Candidatus Gastranaerophilales bacterium]|nr:TolC family protein [Candidatus Gastranaerophilales bacterium]
MNALSVFTLKKYNPIDLEVLDFEEFKIQENIVPVSDFRPLTANIKEQNIDLSFNPQNSLESKYYDFEIEKKKAELEVYKKQRLPSFKFYTNYMMYGQDPNQYFSALSDLKQTSITVGISGTYVFFDGFKNKASREKTALEIKRLQIEKEKKLKELETAYEKSYASYTSYNEELTIKKKLLKEVKDKLSAVSRLSLNGIAEKNDLLSSRAELLSQEFDLQKNIVDISSKIKEIEIMTGEDDKQLQNASS